MNKLLDVELKLNGCKISGKILHQDSSLLYNYNKQVVFRQGEYSIISRSFPELHKKTLYIRGTINSADEDEFSDTYKTEEQAFIAYNAFKDIIYEINNK